MSNLRNAPVAVSILRKDLVAVSSLVVQTHYIHTYYRYKQALYRAGGRWREERRSRRRLYLVYYPGGIPFLFVADLYLQPAVFIVPRHAEGIALGDVYYIKHCACRRRAPDR